MLRYLNSGIRHFGKLHIAAHKRPNWEFYVVLKGRCGVYFEENPDLPVANCDKLPLKESHLWVFPPNHSHGWYGESQTPCDVAVFHFNQVPKLLEDVFENREFLDTSLSAKDRWNIRDMLSILKTDYEKPATLGSLVAERTLLDLSLKVLSSIPSTSLQTTEQKALQKVEAAMKWFTEHMQERPTFRDVAAAVHVSTTHLRKFFAEIREETPHDAMKQARFDAASQL
ncbi:MAG: hypothetical protein ACK5LK_10975, partial [Chthoniobacterales bacterium]